MAACPLGRVVIKNAMFNEYFYVKDDTNDGTRRHVHTLVGGDMPSRGNQKDWIIEHIGPTTFRIKSAMFNEFLYAEDHTGDGRRRPIHTLVGGNEPGRHNANGYSGDWFIEDAGAMGYTIWNRMFQEYLYAKDDLGDGTRRPIHTLVGGEMPGIGSQMYWLIYPAAEGPSYAPTAPLHNLGWITAYHQTNTEGKDGILDGGFKPGAGGALGAAMYFALTEKNTDCKAHKKGWMLHCKLYPGRTLLTEHWVSTMTKRELNDMGYDSLFIVPSSSSDTQNPEIAIFDRARVVIVSYYTWPR